MTELMFKPDETKILKILNIEEEKLNHYLKLFSEWISSQKNLPQNYNETCLKKFLIWAKLDFEKAKKKFIKYCYNSITHKEFICDRIVTTDDDLKESAYVYHGPMRRLTPEGYRVYFMKIFDPDNFDALQFLRAVLLKLDYKIHIDGMVAGEMGIVDMIHMKPHHYAKMFTPTYFKFIKFFVMNLPFLLKNVYIINCHPLLEKGFLVIKTIIPTKLADRFIVLSNPDDLRKYVPLDCLPEELGGTDLSLPALQELWLQHFMDEKDFYGKLSEVKPTGPVPEEFRSVDNEFGVEGSFRQITID